jgi:hypothetical protein
VTDFERRLRVEKVTGKTVKSHLQNGNRNPPDAVGAWPKLPIKEKA